MNLFCFTVYVASRERNPHSSATSISKHLRFFFYFLTSDTQARSHGGGALCYVPSPPLGMSSNETRRDKVREERNREQQERETEMRNGNSPATGSRLVIASQLEN
ncbi:hypothetical protein Hdeb2414_s0008g00266041 [Helianthus debilis subsp. tardiflorus]